MGAVHPPTEQSKKKPFSLNPFFASCCTPQRQSTASGPVEEIQVSPEEAPETPSATKSRKAAAETKPATETKTRRLSSTVITPEAAGNYRRTVKNEAKQNQQSHLIQMLKFYSAILVLSAAINFTAWLLALFASLGILPTSVAPLLEGADLNWRRVGESAVAGLAATTSPFSMLFAGLSLVWSGGVAAVQLSCARILGRLLTDPGASRATILAFTGIPLMVMGLAATRLLRELDKLRKHEREDPHVSRGARASHSAVDLPRNSAAGEAAAAQTTGSQESPEAILGAMTVPAKTGLSVAEYLQSLDDTPRPHDEPTVPRDQWVDSPLYVRHVVDEGTAALAKKQILKRAQRAKSGEPKRALSAIPLDSLPGWKRVLPNGGPTALNGVRDGSTGLWEPSVTPFESELFKGIATIRARGVPSAEYAREYFNQSGNDMQTLIQGTFSKRIRFDTLLSGQLRGAPWRRLPPSIAVKIATKFLELLSPLLIANVYGNRPFLITPTIIGSTIVNVWDPEEAQRNEAYPQQPPDIRCANPHVPEETFALGGPFASISSGWSTDPRKRKAFFQNISNLTSFYFEPNKVYTFHTYERGFSLTTHTVSHVLSVAPYIDGCPIEANAFVDERLAQLLDLETNKSLANATSAVLDELALNGEREWLWRIQFCHEKVGYDKPFEEASDDVSIVESSS